jgi:hypothetical protein
MSWEIFLGIGALLSFIISVSGPMLKLNTSITKLNSSVDVLKAAIDKIEDDNEKNFKELWEHNDEQDDTIADNTKRINNIEHTLIITEKYHPEFNNMFSQLKESNK